MSNPKPVREEALQMVAELTGDSVGYIRMQIGTHGRFVTLETAAVSMAERALKAEAANGEQIRSLFAENESLKAEIASSDEIIEALHQKYIDCPHGGKHECACSCDRPSDICALHAPQLKKALADREKMVELLRKYRRHRGLAHFYCELYSELDDDRCDTCKAVDALLLEGK